MRPLLVQETHSPAADMYELGSGHRQSFDEALKTKELAHWQAFEAEVFTNPGLYLFFKEEHEKHLLSKIIEFGAHWHEIDPLL